MKNKVTISMLVITTIMSLSVAYYEKLRADVGNSQTSKLHKELRQLEQNAMAARIEASKLRFIIDNEKKQSVRAMSIAKY